ncbi:hypothetical protein [Albimonas pacifica]|uniref:Uncharacterized protein n=1 Tax=Albimonas pacifica TaxID=1114924 RepID=A0A1I3JJA8_9RHOB|nr:hypothetical protein [Albimonas pacifica]SFI60352.1 hypothetical protein SAMN05216258_10832 [Albimonas pacifica]
MRTETKIARVQDAPDRAAYWAHVGMRGKARGILKEARDLAAAARKELDAQREQLQAAQEAVTAELARLDEAAR